MNQDQVKTKLLELDNSVEDFTITFSGKKSKKVDGLYKPDKREIILHTENFGNDNQLIYTAIHEFAHHIQFTKSSIPISIRAHINKFWNIFHNLLFDAESKGIYENVFKKDNQFISLTKEIKDKFLSVNGTLMLDFGNLLFQAYELCVQNHAHFDDYVDRELGLHRSNAKSILKVNNLNVTPKIGFENMKTVASIKDEDERKEAEQAFLSGHSPDMVKAQFTTRGRDDEDMDPLEYLMSERDRLEKSVESIIIKISKLDNKIEEIKNKMEEHSDKDKERDLAFT